MSHTENLSMMQISDEEFARIRELIYSRFGIALTEKKKSLVVGRLQKFLRSHGFSDFSSYYDYIVSDKSGKALDELVNRISTNFTYFWREPEHFIHLRDVVLPEITGKLKSVGDYDFRLWCAAAATGEEPYMLAMILRDYFASDYFKWNAGVLATDISDHALSVARDAVYPSKTLDKLPDAFRKKYFRQISTDEWQIVDEIRKELAYRRFNLMNELPFKKPFHVIFCRNVMIYFDQETKKKLVQKMYDCTEKGGYLFVGHSESLGRQECPYKYILPAVYRKM